MTKALPLALAAALAPAAPAGAAVPITPLSQIQPGASCTGLSVVRGTAISSFSVEVLDVVSGDPGSATGPRILVRVSGPAVDATGVGFGFSGSPVLCPPAGGGTARLAGAISETLGEFGNHTVLATPIEEVLGEPAVPPPSARRDPRMLRSARALSGPLTVTGISARVRRALRAGARRPGVRVLAAPGGPARPYPVQVLQPGASVSAGLSTGDLAIGSVGTVTARDGTTVWAFGHPLDAAGRRALLLQDAYVFGVIANPGAVPEASSYKLAAGGHTVGTITNDALSSVVGRLGLPTPTVPLRVSGRDLDTGRITATLSHVTDERALDLPPALETVGLLGLGQVSDASLRSLPPRVSSSLCLRIRIRERQRPLSFCNSYFDGAGPYDDYGRAIDEIEAFSFGALQVTGVEARLRLRRGVREAFVLSGRATRRVRPGRRVRIRLRIQRRRGGRRTISFRFRVPRGTRPGLRTLTLSPTKRESPEDGLSSALGDALEQIFSDEGDGGEEDSRARSLDELYDRVASIQQPQGLRGTFGSRGGGRLVLRSNRLLLRGQVEVPLRVVRGRGRLRSRPSRLLAELPRRRR